MQETIRSVDPGIALADPDVFRNSAVSRNAVARLLIAKLCPVSWFLRRITCCLLLYFIKRSRCFALERDFEAFVSAFAWSIVFFDRIFARVNQNIRVPVSGSAASIDLDGIQSAHQAKLIAAIGIKVICQSQILERLKRIVACSLIEFYGPVDLILGNIRMRLGNMFFYLIVPDAAFAFIVMSVFDAILDLGSLR